jgi:hypothetical protein
LDGDEHGRTQCHFGGIPKPQGIGNDVFEETGNDVFEGTGNDLCEGTGNDLCEAWELKAGVVTVDGLSKPRRCYVLNSWRTLAASDAADRLKFDTQRRTQPSSPEIPVKQT